MVEATDLHFHTWHNYSTWGVAPLICLPHSCISRLIEGVQRTYNCDAHRYTHVQGNRQVPDHPDHSDQQPKEEWAITAIVRR